jgi:hypothetical protein
MASSENEGIHEGVEMKHLFVGLVAATTLGVGAGATAMAADMVLKAPTAPIPLFSWTGLYIGGSLGYGWVAMAPSILLQWERKMEFSLMVRPSWLRSWAA